MKSSQREDVTGREALVFSPDVSYRFIQNSQNIQLNRIKDLNDIYHFIKINEATDGVDADFEVVDDE
ncbi:MAG TPA: hypothetical protein EYN42_01135 [Candidatus Poseidoniales archaeon]|nr:hypothetical protein [Candidatus Poseidoniales archaeon]